MRYLPARACPHPRIVRLRRRVMVDRVYQRNVSESAPQPPTDPQTGYPTAGNPAQAIPATVPGPYWYHMITESLRRVVTDAGLEPDHLELGRLAAAIRKAATVDAAGMVRFATEEEHLGGESEEVATHPAGVAAMIGESLAPDATEEQRGLVALATTEMAQELEDD